MGKVEVLVAAMHQEDFSLIELMNIHSDVIIANQCETDGFIEKKYSFGKAKMIFSSTRGVGKNRNLGLIYATGDYLLFSDQDVQFYPEYENVVVEAFAQFQDADVICFGTDFTKKGEIYSSRLPKKGKLKFKNSLKFGTYGIAIKKTAILKYNLRFTELFGGGCIYSHGEDSDFIIQCFRKKLKVYAYDKIICKTSKDTSTCFEGYNEKYFFDTGALAMNSLSFLIRELYILYISLRIKTSFLSFFSKLSLLHRGKKAFANLMSYTSYIGAKK